MRPRNETARDLLPGLLRRNPGAKAAALAAMAGVSDPTMLRMLKAAANDVVRVGKAGHSCYYLRRALLGQADDIAVYAVDTTGQVRQQGVLQLLAPQGTFLDVAAMGWPVDAEFALGVWPHGLPYPLQDMRPQGFLGRQFAHRQGKALGVSTNPKDWSDDDALRVLVQTGSDTSGNLILGHTALQHWLDDKAQPAPVLTPQTLEQGYADRARLASEGGVVGSSTGGEFPKFTALRDVPGAHTPHVIVKFSAADTASTVQRWSDLLVCEHLALQAMGTLAGVQSARSRLLQHQGRTFLEVERFDRHGLHGRSPLCSLDTLEAALLSKTSTDWADAGEQLCAHGWLNAADVAQLRVIWAFGKLIGNTDMHKGNLSFVPSQTLPAPTLQLAPVYDMLPMLYAPLGGGEIAQSTFAPGLPTPKNRAAWLTAHPAACRFWLSAAADTRISQAFRAICQANAALLLRLLEVA